MFDLLEVMDEAIIASGSGRRAKKAAKKATARQRVRAADARMAKIRAANLARRAGGGGRKRAKVSKKAAKRGGGRGGKRAKARGRTAGGAKG